MRRQQFIQIGQFILIRVLIRGFVVFVLEQSFVEFLLRYRFFFLVASISYFYYYSIQYELDKKYNLIRNAIIYGNVYLFAHVFFRPLLNISHELFVLLGLIILGLWGTTKMKSRRKIGLQILGGIFSFFILISGIFYLYPDEPDIDGFIKTQTYEISVLGADQTVAKNDAYLQITNAKKSEDFLIEPYFTKILSEDCKISYPSLKRMRDEKILISSPQGDIFLLFPQSEIQIKFSGQNIEKITKLNGKVGFLSGIFSSSIEYVGDVEELDEEQKIFVQSVQQNYKSDFVSYLKNQISDSQVSLTNSTIMYNIDGKILNWLARMFPTSFGNNLRNYNEFQSYFAWIDEETMDLSRYSIYQGSTGGGIKTLRKNLKNNMKIGTKNIYTFW